MKLFRRVIFFAALLITLICIVLLLNFTAPNPTGRRYSSASPLTRGSAQDIGLSGEQILAQDLHLPRNDDADQRQCICNSAIATPADCRACIVSSPEITTYRRPDFIGASFIAESKNRQNLLYSYTDQVDQIRDYVLAAQLLGRPLWLYTRIDTVLDPAFARLVSTTGGGVVPYFTTPGYVDPIDRTARSGLVIALIVFVLMIIWEMGVRRFRSPATPKDSLAKAEHRVSTADDFVKAAKARAQRKIDVEDARYHNDQ